MTSIKDWQDSMSDVDGWAAEAVDLIDEDDVKTQHRTRDFAWPWFLENHWVRILLAGTSPR